MTMMMEFLDKDIPLLVVSLTAAGQLQPTLEFPSSTKTKAVYFAKRFVFVNQWFDFAVILIYTYTLPIYYHSCF